MRVVVPHAGADWTLWAVARNLEAQGVDYELADVSGSDEAYPDLLGSLWRHGEPFVVVEHDILPWPGAVHELIDCPEPLCGFPYVLGNRIGAYLGCTRISARVIAATQYPWPHRSWAGLDLAIFAMVRSAGFGFHVHHPAVVHLNPSYKVHLRPGAGWSAGGKVATAFGDKAYTTLQAGSSSGR